MKRLVLIGILVTCTAQLFAQCTNCLSQNPAATQSTTSPSFVNISPCMQGGQYALCNVTAGQQYEFQTCATSGYDTQITLFDNATGCGGPALAYNDDYCGLQSDVTWTATFTGVVRVLVSQYYCGSNATCATLDWRCVTCSLPPFCYSVSGIAYSWTSLTAPTTVTLGDDQVSGAQPIGFTFCFAGSGYTQFYIGSNGWISFSSGQTASWVPAAIPNASTPMNSILCAWLDWYPPGGGSIYYKTIGTAPNRQLVVTWDNVSMYSCTSLHGTFQIVLYETTNVIDNNIAVKPVCTSWSGGINATQGVQDASGASAAVVPGRNCTQWTTSNDSYRFSPTCGTCSTVLPVELTDFSGETKERVNILRWSTASELNNWYFTVERSSDGINWSLIGTMPGAGTTALPHAYSLEDPFPPGGINYYRLKQTDYNGDYRYYHVIALETQSRGGITVFPNPADQAVHIQAGGETIFAITITDAVGRPVYSTTPGSNSATVDISMLPAGVYMVEVQSGGRMVRRKLVKE